MIADVTQNLAIRIVPVNRPTQSNEYGEHMGYYRAYVVRYSSSNTGPFSSHINEHELDVAAREIDRGIVPMNVGYGSASDPRGAIDNALVDYQHKFGKLCQAEHETSNHT